tara:strand:+ start:1389 stop:1907 length:519 start_codon:yes stop_codon:yes gene_type:complete
MVAFGVIGFLILVIIFVVMRNQSTQRELKQIRRAHKLLQSQNKYSLGIVMAMSTHLQYVFQTKLASLNNHGLIKRQDYDIAHFILENFQFIIVQCCQHNETVEVAVRKALKGQALTIEFVSQFIARQPSEVRVPWCKNTVDGFIAACRNLVADKVKTQAEEVDSTINSPSSG